MYRSISFVLHQAVYCVGLLKHLHITGREWVEGKSNVYDASEFYEDFRAGKVYGFGSYENDRDPIKVMYNTRPSRQTYLQFSLVRTR